jgi:hypothetical protein
MLTANGLDVELVLDQAICRNLTPQAAVAPLPTAIGAGQAARPRERHESKIIPRQESAPTIIRIATAFIHISFVYSHPLLKLTRFLQSHS